MNKQLESEMKRAMAVAYRENLSQAIKRGIALAKLRKANKQK